MISELDVIEMKIFFFYSSSLLDNVVGKSNDFIGAFFLGLTAISRTVLGKHAVFNKCVSWINLQKIIRVQSLINVQVGFFETW